MATRHPRGEIQRRQTPDFDCPAHGPQCSPSVHSPTIVFPRRPWFRQDDVKRSRSTACEVQPVRARSSGCCRFGGADCVVGLWQRRAGNGDHRCQQVDRRDPARFPGGWGGSARRRWWCDRRGPARCRHGSVGCRRNVCAGRLGLRRGRRDCTRSADVVLGSARGRCGQLVYWLRPFWLRH